MFSPCSKGSPFWCVATCRPAPVLASMFPGGLPRLRPSARNRFDVFHLQGMYMKWSRCGCMLIGMLLAGHAWADGACQLRDYGTLPVEMINGRPTTMIKINGTDSRFIVDTGAFFNMMPNAKALSLNLKPWAMPENFHTSGVGGITSNMKYANVKEFGLLGSSIDNIGFLVGGSDTGDGLLGANVLDAADLELDLSHGKMTMFSTYQCGNSPLAYWVKQGGYNVADLKPSRSEIDRRSFVDVLINGKTLHAVLDTGAGYTVMSRAAAERIGIDLNGPGAKASGGTSGIGSRAVKTWTVDIDSFTVGTETIHHSQMEVIDGNLGDAGNDILLGVDFILAHHMYIANSQNKLYFTYNGGRVFTLAAAPADSGNASAGAGAGAAAAAPDPNAPPKSASDYALQGEAELSRGENSAALADLGQAIRLAPDQSAYYVARARAYNANRQFDAIPADLDKALSLDPKNVDALLMRARYRFAHKDLAGATADVTAANSLAPAGSPQAMGVARLYIQLKQPANALPLLDDWIRLHPGDVELGAGLNERCWARALANQLLDDALKDCRKAIDRDGENDHYLDSLGLVQLRLGHYPESIKAYQQSIAKNPRSAWAHYGLGVAEIRGGQKDAGNAELATAMSINKGIEELAQGYGVTAAP
jgi:tetratricopeptide (TPR) repeat protein/predicted aspartyl protease